jgi:hypothetical protein
MRCCHDVFLQSSGFPLADVLLPIFVGMAVAAPLQAEFTVYAGDVAQEIAWQAALGGSVPKETFEGFTGVPGPGVGGDMLAALPSVHVIFDPVVPGVYDDAQWAHSGTKQWSNWAGGAGNSASHVLRPEPGRSILALGFWNCDPQGDQPILAYDVNNQLVGTISGHVNTHNSHPELSDSFAGFISTIPVAYLQIPGALGDGWNHFDDLQVVTQVTADYNHNGIVDIADYVVWRETLGQTGANLAADGTGSAGIPDSDVNQLDYDFWRAHFGELVAPAATASLSRIGTVVPEPTTALVLLICLIAGVQSRLICCCRRAHDRGRRQTAMVRTWQP